LKAPATLLQSAPCLLCLSPSPRRLLSHPSPRILRPLRSRMFSGTRSSSSRSRSGCRCRCRGRRSLLRCRRIRRRRCIHRSHHRLGCSPCSKAQRAAESNRIHTRKCSRSYRTGESCKLNPLRQNIPHPRCIQPQAG
jgi:hypothetical protein